MARSRVLSLAALVTLGALASACSAAPDEDEAAFTIAAPTTTAAAAAVVPAYTAGRVTITPTPTVTPTATATATKTPASAPSSTTKKPSPSKSTSKPASSTTKPASASSSSAGMSKLERQVVTLVNQERAKAGCGALAGDSRLAKASGLYASQMVAEKFFAHQSPSGSTPSSRAEAAGFPSGAGENIALGYPDAAAVVKGWMESPGHKANILNCGYTVTGVGQDPGVAQEGFSAGVWVQMFGSL